MPQVQYPFIDVAVHPAVRGRFAAGESIVLFSRDMHDVLWANGDGARLFGHDAIYDLIESGPDRASVSYRQLGAAAAQLAQPGDKRSFMMRIAVGFRTTAAPAEVSLIEIAGQPVVMFSTGNGGAPRYSSMLEGFDDPDTHMALLDASGAPQAASAGFASIGILTDTVRALIAAANRSADGLVKRPVATGAGYVPAAIGRLTDDLYLLFCVETALGRMDAPEQEPDAPLADVVARPEAEAVSAVDMVAHSVDPEAVEGHIAEQPGSEPAIDTERLEGVSEVDIAELAAMDGADADLIASEARDDSEFETDPDLADAIPAAMNDERALDAVAGEELGAAPTDPAEPAAPLAMVTEPDQGQPIAATADFVAGQSAEDAASVADFIAEQAVADDVDQVAQVSEEGALADSPQPSETFQSETITPADDADTESTMGSDETVDGPMMDAPAPEEAMQIEAAEPAAFLAAQEDGEPAEPLASDHENVLPVEEVSEQRAATFPEVQDAAPLKEAATENLSENSGEASAAPDADGAGADEEANSSVEAEDLSEPAVDVPAQATATEDESVETDADEMSAYTVTAAEVVADDSASSEPVADVDVATDHADESSGALTDLPPAAEPAFAFNRGGRPVRFVWKLDAEGRFDGVSEEFGRAVGPRAGNINGRLFRDLAESYDLDPGQEVAGLLERRDTWSGRTIRWPVEGTDLLVPVDLAALPTYSRDREFEGFRGFGIVRVADAEIDPRALGRSITADNAPLTHEDVPLTVDGQFDEHLHDEAPALDEPAPSEPVAEVPADEAPVSVPVDEFRGEVPALNIVSNPLSTFSDKIIQLEERRARGRDGLSATEQAALKEIARQLEPFGKRPNEELRSPVSETPDAVDPAAEAPSETAEIAPETEVEQGFAVVPASVQMDEPAAEEAREQVVPSVEPVSAADMLEEAEASEDETDSVDEDATAFETLGEGPGLTADAVDQVPLAILIHAGDHLIHANSEFKRLTGYDSIAALDDAGGLDALIARREGPDAGVYLIRQDGSQTMISARLQSVRFAGSSALMLALTPMAAASAVAPPAVNADNDTARQVAALTVEVNELRAILETATDGVIILDTEGRIRSLNRSAAGLFNFDDAETRGKPFSMLFAHESQKSVQDYLAGLAGHGVASVLNDGREVIGREASGGFIPLFMTMGRLPGSNSYCAVIRDITQWKRSEEELRTAKRAAETANQHKSDFLARVSHEIRTPLNAIIGFSDMIASEHLGPAGHTRYVEYASDIGRSGRHVLDIVNDLLDISKIEAGEMDLEFAAVGLNDCVSEAVSLVQPQANAQRVIIRTSLSQSVPDVVADLRSIKQIAINILANAIRFTPSGGQIVVSTVYEASGSVMLRIRDTGVGMSKAELELAMKPFGQVSAGTRQRGEGTGLGLPLTKAMTEANRAVFAIHSAPNEGTLVEIVFPPQRVLAD